MAPPLGWRIRDGYAAVVLCYAFLLPFLIGVSGWMTKVWLGVAVAMTLLASLALLIRSVITDGAPLRLRDLAGAQRAWPVVAATIAFAIVHVLAAALESRDTSRLDRNYWLLGFGMAQVVLLYLAAYDRKARRNKKPAR